MIDDSSQSDPEPITTTVRVVERYAKAAMAGALIAYALGFLIISLHLSGLGATPIELVRGRYVLVGSLFLIFAGSIWTSALAFYGRILAEPSCSEGRRLYHFVAVTVKHYGVAAIVAMLVNAVSSWSTLLNPEPVMGRLVAEWALLLPKLVFICIGVAVVVVFQLIIGLRRGASAVSAIRQSASWVLGMGVSGLIISLFSAAQRFIGASNGLELGEGWLRFLVVSFASFVVSVYVGLFVGVDVNARRSPSDREDRVGYRVWVRGLLFAFLLMTYSHQVFPYLPLSVGGGLPVCAIIERDSAPGSASDWGADALSWKVRIVDRTESRILFLHSNGTDDRVDVVEMPADRIRRITACRDFD